MHPIASQPDSTRERPPARALQKTERESRLEMAVGTQVPTGDGAVLRTDIHRPADGGPFPTVLVRTPYGSTDVMMLKLARALATRGLAVVVQNVRGRYGSGGTFTPFAHEAEDGAATLAWLGEQPWCDGRVIAFGISYSSFTAFALSHRSEQASVRLVGMVSLVAMASPYHHFYRHGAFVLHWAMPWYQLIQGNRQGRVGHLDLPNLAHAPLGAIPTAMGLPEEPWRTWTTHQTADDPFWRRLDQSAALAASGVPVLSLGGWYDFTLDSTLDLHRHLSRTSPSVDHRLVVGPWEHNSVFRALVAALEGTDRADHALLATAFTDSLARWLNASDRAPAHAHEEPVWLWQTRSERDADAWRNVTSWPPPGRTQTIALRPQTSHVPPAERAEGAPNDLVATRHEAHWDHRPDQSVPSVGGRCWTVPGWVKAGPIEQPDHRQRQDVLTLETAPCAAVLEVCGSIVLRLAVRIERVLGSAGDPLAGDPLAGDPLAGRAPRIDLCAKLLDVDPAGRATWVSDGILRMEAQAQAQTAPRVATIARIAIDLGATCYCFQQSHRLRLELASSSFPQFDRADSGPLGFRLALRFDTTGQNILMLPATARTACDEP